MSCFWFESSLFTYHMIIVKTTYLQWPKKSSLFLSLAYLSCYVIPQLRVDKWWGNRKELATVRTICSHVQNMIKGVTLVRALSYTENTQPAVVLLFYFFALKTLLFHCFCRVSGTKCAPYMPIFPSMLWSRRMEAWLKSGTFWERSTFAVFAWGRVRLP